METYTYTCNHCQKPFVPTRRKVQKFCSDSCRSGNHQHNKRMDSKLNNSGNESKVNPESIGKIDKMSLAGVGNAAAGSLAFDLLKMFLTKHDNRPATKKDLQDLERLISRNEKVNNKILEILNKNPFSGFQT